MPPLNDSVAPACLSPFSRLNFFDEAKPGTFIREPRRRFSQIPGVGVGGKKPENLISVHFRHGTLRTMAATELYQAANEWKSTARNRPFSALSRVAISDIFLTPVSLSATLCP